MKCRARGEPREGGAVLPLVKMMWRNTPEARRQEVCVAEGAGRVQRGGRGAPSLGNKKDKVKVLEIRELRKN